MFLVALKDRNESLGQMYFELQIQLFITLLCININFLSLLLEKWEFMHRDGLLAESFT